MQRLQQRSGLGEEAPTRFLVQPVFPGGLMQTRTIGEASEQQTHTAEVGCRVSEGNGAWQHRASHRRWKLAIWHEENESETWVEREGLGDRPVVDECCGDEAAYDRSGGVLRVPVARSGDGERIGVTTRRGSCGHECGRRSETATDGISEWTVIATRS